jgi:hypothetical protein
VYIAKKDDLVLDLSFHRSERGAEITDVTVNYRGDHSVV